MHGGAPGSGAPIGSQNALKSGLFTREAIEERRALRDLIRSARQLAEDRVTVATGSLRLSKHYPHYFSGRFALWLRQESLSTTYQPA
jgi:DNA-nicking Smr family endonuclease